MLLILILVTFTANHFVISFDYSDGLWRKNLNVCWTDPECIRKLTISHGGDWNATLPYDSIGAFEKAYDIGADVVKGDFRVSKDNIGMVMHSSPILIYESFDCFHKKVEEQTAKQNSECHMIYTNYTFSTVPDILKWSQNKINFMFCVKETSDIPRAITTLIENHATNRAFLEISVDEILNIVMNNSEGWEDVYYIINMGNIDEFNRMISSPSNVLKRTILFEFNDWESWPSTDLTNCITKTHELGLHTVAASHSNPITSTVKNHLDIYNHNFDVAYTYNLNNAIEARKIINTENHVFPA